MLVAVQDALRLAILEGGRSARAADGYLPIVVPVTGFMSVAGGSHRYGAVMAAQNAPSGLKVEAPVFDTGASASGAATALDKALSDKPALAPSASVFGTKTVAMVLGLR
jgi:branched-chain amino acid transport system substrate-binding protein